MSGTALAVGISAAVPLAFVYAVRRFDLYASGGLRIVGICFAWGTVAFAISVALNTRAAAFLSFFVLTVVFAPVVEELSKSAALVYFVRRPDFTYFVDGAIFGFAAGTGFAVVENIDYLQGRADPLAFAVNRVFTTSLMHGTASAIVGVSLGRFRFSHRRARFGSMLLGWGAAIALHATFNALVKLPHSAALVYFLWGVGLTGVVLVVAFIRLGLREEKAWLKESLSLEVNVSRGESELVQELHQLDVLLAPVAEHFGTDKRGEVEQLLRLQTTMGLKRKTADLTPDPRLRAQLLEQVEALKARAADLQGSIGIYCMGYVRSILPPDGDALWDTLSRALEERAASDPSVNLWDTLAERSTG